MFYKLHSPENKPHKHCWVFPLSLLDLDYSSNTYAAAVTMGIATISSDLRRKRDSGNHGIMAATHDKQQSKFKTAAITVCSNDQQRLRNKGDSGNHCRHPQAVMHSNRCGHQ